MSGFKRKGPDADDDDFDDGGFDDIEEDFGDEEAVDGVDGGPELKRSRSAAGDDGDVSYDVDGVGSGSASGINRWRRAAPPVIDPSTQCLGSCIYLSLQMSLRVP